MKEIFKLDVAAIGPEMLIVVVKTPYLKIVRLLTNE